MPTMEIHQRTIRRGVYVHNAGELVFVAYFFVMKNTRKSSELSPVWASLWNWWEDLCKQVPGEEKVKLFFWFTSFWSFCCNFFSLEGSCGRNRSSMPRRVPLLNRRWAFPFFSNEVLPFCALAQQTVNFSISFSNEGVFCLTIEMWIGDDPHFLIYYCLQNIEKKNLLLKNFVSEKHCSPMTPPSQPPCRSYIVWNIFFWPECLNC